MRIQMLGPLCVWRDGHELELGPAAQRAVLGLLALGCGKPAPRAEIMNAIWPDRLPPPTASNVIQTYVKHLRRLLEPARRPRGRSTVLRQAGDGYALDVSESDVDLLRFRDRVSAAAAAQRHGELDRAAELLDEALGLWQGPPLADIPVLATHPKVAALAGERQAALSRYGEVMIATGRAAEGLPALEEAAARDPMDEAGQARLIRAYHAAGRRERAFATFHDVRRRLADELGVAPGPELSAAHAALLHDQDPSTPAPEVMVRPASVGPGLPVASGQSVVPAQLPADPPDFVGRQTELSQLDRLLDRVHSPSGPAVVCAVSGTAGVGKTTLAVHWAHRVAHRFPDGQVYVNLRGFDPSGVVMDPAEAVRRFIDALAVPVERIPPGLDAQAALYRSQLVGRRMLIVLDNARDAAQVRPLLPGGSGCLVLVTSRNDLSSLVATEGATPLLVDLLDTDEARDLLEHRLGGDRTSAESGAVDEIVARCAGLPLALAVVAARAAVRRRLPLVALAAQLRRSRDRLDALSTGDPSTDLRAVLSWSYQALTTPAARLFRLLGLHPGPDIATPAVASLAALPFQQARDLLAELVGANLVVEHEPGRYALHDLLRVYADDLTTRIDRDRQRRAATHRMLDHYLHSARAADRLLNPAREQIAATPLAPGVAPERPVDHDQARNWFAAEHPVLLAVVDLASTVSDSYTWRIAWTLFTFLDRQGHWDDLVDVETAAVAATRRQSDPSALALAHRLLARAYTRLDRLDDASTDLQHSLDLCRQTGDQLGQGNTHLFLALIWDRRGRYRESLEEAQRALEMFEAADDKHGQARALNSIGWSHTLLGDHAEALTVCQHALVQLQQLDDRSSQASTWDTLGNAHMQLGEHAEAVECYQHAIDLYHGLGDRHLEAIVRSHLGDTHHRIGNPQAARDAWQEAFAFLRDVDQREAEKAREKLASVG